MNVQFINPFVEGVDNVFETMLGMKPKRHQLKVSGSLPDDVQCLTSMIGISGEVSGMVALRFPEATALALAGRFLGNELSEIDDSVVDAISELVNMVGGSAKAKFDHDPPLQLGLPTVVAGAKYRVKYPSKSILLEVPYSSDAGDFAMEVTYSPN